VWKFDSECQLGFAWWNRLLQPLNKRSVFFISRSDTALEVLALRQQLAVLKRKRPGHP